MQKITGEGRHLADKQQLSDTERTKHFMKLARHPREVFHVNHSHQRANLRLQHFMRISRGHTA